VQHAETGRVQPDSIPDADDVANCRSDHIGLAALGFAQEAGIDHRQDMSGNDKIRSQHGKERITMAWNWGRKKPETSDEIGSSIRSRGLDKSTLREPALTGLIAKEKEIAHMADLAASGRIAEIVKRFKESDDPVGMAFGLDDIGAIVGILKGAALDPETEGILKGKLAEANATIMRKVFRHGVFLESSRIGLFYPQEAHVGGGLPLIFGSHMDHMITLGKEICVFVHPKEITTSHSVNERGEILARQYHGIMEFSPELVLIPPTEEGSLIPQTGAIGICVCYGFQADRILANQGIVGAASMIITEREEVRIR